MAKLIGKRKGSKRDGFVVYIYPHVHTQVIPNDLGLCEEMEFN